MRRFFDSVGAHAGLLLEDDKHERSKCQLRLDENRKRSEIEEECTLERQFLSEKFNKTFDRATQADRQFSRNTTTPAATEHFEAIRRRPIELAEAATLKEIQEKKLAEEQQIARNALLKEATKTKHGVFAELHSLYRSQKKTLQNLQKLEKAGWVVGSPRELSSESTQQFIDTDVPTSPTFKRQV